MVGHVPRSFCRYYSQYLLIRGSTVLCKVTGKRVNRGAGYGLEIPCRYTINGNKLAVRWLSELILKEATIVKDAVVRNLETKTGRKRKNRGSQPGVRDDISWGAKTWIWIIFNYSVDVYFVVRAVNGQYFRL